MNTFKILDKYIAKQLGETFLLGIVIFTTIMFASDTFINLVKQITNYGIPLKIAFLILILKLPSILVLTIPMGVLMSTILTFNKLSLNSEIYVMRACRISLTRLGMPVMLFAISVGLLSFMISEFVAPAANTQAKNLMLVALSKHNIPDGKSHFSFKEMSEENTIKRLFYIDKSEDGVLSGLTVLDMSKKDSIQIVQSKYGKTLPDRWVFNKGRIYAISNSGKVLNSTVFNKLEMEAETGVSSKVTRQRADELNYFDLKKHIIGQKKIISTLNAEAKNRLIQLTIQLHEKIAVPFTALCVALIGVPLAITPPRAVFNRGLLFSIMIIFCYYIIRAFSISLGQAEIIPPMLSAWMPNVIIGTTGLIMYYRKAYRI